MTQLGVVIIGRNEGERLRQCFESLEISDPNTLQHTLLVTYVDSGSTDGSVDLAKSYGAEVVELDPSIPFTAARARNAGFDRLIQVDPTIQQVQFVDGDCRIAPGWIDQAQQALATQPDVVVVCGRRREQFPDQSIYNRLCDLEWDTPIGEAKACGGDAMIRVAAFQAVGGFDPTLIAGEEPELCLRLRRQGGKILRLDAEMTLHDARMIHFGQWWKRSLRAGHAYAEGSWMHGRSPDRHWVRERRSIWLWGLGLPLLALITAWWTWGLSVGVLIGLELLQVYRIYRRVHQQDRSASDAWLYAVFCMIAKFPQLQGQILFHWARLRGQRRGLVEYKQASGQPTQKDPTAPVIQA